MFQKTPIHDLLSSRLKDAANQVSSLGLDQLRDPALAGLLNRLWTSCVPEVPVIFRDRRRGSKRVEQQRKSDHGRSILVDVTYLDVAVPFQGDRSMFDVLPSTSSVIMEPVHVREGALIYSLPLDEANDEKIDRVLGRIEANLRIMRNDVENFSRSAVDQLLRRAAERRAKLEDDDKKGKNFSFPVD